MFLHLPTRPRSTRLACAAVLLFIVLGLGFAGRNRDTLGQPRAAEDPARTAAASATGAAPGASDTADQGQPAGGFEQLPPADRESLGAAWSKARHAVQPLDAREASMEVNEGARLFAFNPGQGLTARFRDGEVALGSDRTNAGWQAVLRLESVAGQKFEPKPSPASQGARVEYDHGAGLTEWYENRPAGLEHGLTLAKRPEGAEAAGELRIGFNLRGLSARMAENAVEFVEPSRDQAVLRYDKLLVRDASGREIPARMEASESGVSLVVADSRAVYPLTVDPLITSLEARLGPPSNAGPGAADDKLGRSVALDGNTALLGAPGDDTAAGNNAGSAYVFERTGPAWSLRTRLTAADAEAFNTFGSAVSLHGDTALIGSPTASTGRGEGAGAAYVFVRNGGIWTQQARLTADDGNADENFGRVLALNGNTALVGSPLSNVASAYDSGAAYVFVRSGTTWAQQAKLTVAGARANDAVGSSVALDADTAVIGAPNLDYITGAAKGAAFVFTRSGSSWTQQAKLTANDGETGDAFGFSVAVQGDTAVLGSRNDGSPGKLSHGSAYVFARDGTTWTQQAKLLSSDGSAYDYFGSKVALDGDTALVGNNSEETILSTTESAYVFVRTGTAWSQQARLVSDNWKKFDAFGCSLALSGDTALVGMMGFSTDAGASAGAACVFTRQGTAWSPPVLLTTGGGSAGDNFGFSLALSGNTALIGSLNDSTPAGNTAGTAHVFVRSGTAWSHQMKLTAADGAYADYFGHAVSLDQDTAVISALGADLPGAVPPAGGDAGAAYVFARAGATWTQQAKLMALDAEAGNQFGLAVSVHGDRALVGSSRAVFAMVPDAGRAYVFARNAGAWSQEAKLTATDGEALDYFGWSVALEGDTALVGAKYETSAAGYHAGSAYVFTRGPSGWSQQAKLTANDGKPQAEFGFGVALSGDTALVGSPYDTNDIGYTAGSAYVFARSGTAWSQQAKLIPAANGFPDEHFGWSLALRGGTALIGVPYAGQPYGTYTGSAYVFARKNGTWGSETKLTATSPAANDNFGFAVALDGDTALAGAYQDSGTDALTGDPVTGEGSVHVFRIEGVLTPFALWAQAQGLTGSPALETANPDGDLANNLTEYAFNLDPLGRDSSTLTPSTGTKGLPFVSLTGNDPDRHLRVEYVRRKASTNPDLSYAVEFGTDLAQVWVEQGGAETVTALDATWERVVVEDTVTTGSASRRFGRVRVTAVP